MFLLFIRLLAKSLINAGRHSSQHGAYLAQVWSLKNKRQDDSDLAVAYLRHLHVNNSNENGYLRDGNSECYKYATDVIKCGEDLRREWKKQYGHSTYNVTSRRFR